MVSYAIQAEGATALVLSTVVKALPQGASLDLIVSTPVMYQALKSCADIISHAWDMDTYCHHPGWKEVMTVWTDEQVRATVREVNEEGVDSENSPFLALALREIIQTVRDGMHDRDSQMGDQWGNKRRETAPIS
jgi:hypothetical protein